MVEQNGDMDLDRDPAAETEAEGIDLDQVKEMAGFVLRAGRRRLVLTTMTFVIIAAVGLTIAVLLPKSYTAQVKILAQRTGALRALSSPNSEMTRVDDPTKNVANMILRHDNLTALIKQANLVERFEEARAPVLRFKDRVMTWMYGPASDEDKLLVMESILEKKIDIVTDENTMVITVDWPIAQMAYEIVNLVQKNFLEARYDSDLAVITDSISVLQEHAKGELARLNAALEEYQRVAPAAAAAPAAQAGATASRAGLGGSPRRDSADGAIAAATSAPAPSLALEETRLRIRALEQERHRLQDAIQQQLAQAQLTMTPMHPTVVALQQRLDSMTQPSAELSQLKSDERTLSEAAEAAAFAPRSTDTSAGASAGSHPPAGAVAAMVPPSSIRPTDAHWAPEDGPTRLARSKLEAAIQSYEAATARIEAANMELDITRAAYKYRYTVLTPAEPPSKPKKPMTEIIATASVIGGALFAFLFAAMADILSGKVFETWQVRRRLKLEVIGELDRSP